MFCPQLDVTEALRLEAQHFADCIRNKKTPITDGYSGLRVVSVLEAATRSMKSQGKAVPLKSYAMAAAAFAD
jgi:predicted dehydrogenase